MVTLGLVCLFLSFILLIMGLMAWGAMNMERPETETVESSEVLKPDETTPKPGA
jgi:hypothetical protein